jgi:hypothetical protein
MRMKLIFSLVNDHYRVIPAGATNKIIKKAVNTYICGIKIFVDTPLIRNIGTVHVAGTECLQVSSGVHAKNNRCAGEFPVACRI